MTLSKLHQVASLFIVVGLAFMVLLGPLVADVSAQETNEAKAQLSIKPVDAGGSYFELTMSPGETRQLQVELGNLGEAAGDARTFAADAYTIINGGLGIRLDGEPTSGATHWLDYQIETLTLGAGEAVVRTFEVSVPNDVAPGEYLTALVIQNAEPTGGENNDGVAFKQVNRQAISVAIDVPGERSPALAFGDAEHHMVTGLSVIRTGVENPGNVRLRPSGEFTLTGPDGVEISNIAVTMSSIYAGTDTRSEANLPELLPAGEYVVTLWLEDSEHGIREESGPIPLSVPELVAPVQMPAQVAETDTVPVAEAETQPVIEAQIVGVPMWMLLVAIPVTLILGIVIAFFALKRRMQPAIAATTSGPVPQVVVRENPPATVASKPVPMRQMMPPSRNNDTTDTEK